MSVKMYGPAQDESRTIVNREVDDHDVPAYQAAGYKVGTLEGAPDEKTYVPVKPKTTADEGAKKGKLPEDFPGFASLADAEITTYAQLRKVDELTSIPGIGEATAEKITEALKG